MKVCVQWATDPAQGWIEIDSRAWSSLPLNGPVPAGRKPIFDPVSGVVVGFSGPPVAIGSSPGWVNAVCVQGVVFGRDHTAVEHNDADGCVDVTSWSDDDTDPQVWRFFPEEVTHKEVYQDGSWTRSTGLRQELIVFSDKPLEIITNGGPATIMPRNAFVAPTASVGHGIWLLQPQFDALHAIQPPAWESWKGAAL